MALALQRKPPFSPAATIRALVSSLRPTLNVSAPMNLRATESTTWWTGTSATADDSQRLPNWVTIAQEPTPGFTELAAAANGLAEPPTATDNPDHGMAALTIAADNGDERAFLAAKAQIDWSQRSASDFVSAIQLALAAGAHRAASNLAVRGAEQHPGSNELRIAAYVLAPPTAVVRRVPANPAAVLDNEWLQIHRDQYLGQWVALCGGNFLGNADALATLTTRFGIDPDILYTRVF